jgi:hypothetical protein
MDTFVGKVKFPKFLQADGTYVRAVAEIHRDVYLDENPLFWRVSRQAEDRFVVHKPEDLGASEVLEVQDHVTVVQIEYSYQAPFVSTMPHFKEVVVDALQEWKEENPFDPDEFQSEEDWHQIGLEELSIIELSGSTGKCTNYIVQHAKEDAVESILDTLRKWVEGEVFAVSLRWQESKDGETWKWINSPALASHNTTISGIIGMDEIGQCILDALCPPPGAEGYREVMENAIVDGIELEDEHAQPSCIYI